MQIEGTVVYQKLGTGFWGVLGENNQKWQISNLPDSLKVEGKKVSLKVEELKGAMSVFMWGKMVKIID
ncbi:MAG: hypothetical protein EAZ97_16140 [Bacteroidetes bacterium]|nr:MAG: hypothetical protein EAZ97_16140 [Bacteroidota bacterium]